MFIPRRAVLRDAARRFALILALSWLSGAALLGSFAESRLEELRTLLSADERHHVDMQKRIIGDMIHETISDLLLLLETGHVREILRRDRGGAEERFAAAFRSLCLTTGRYARTSVIDTSEILLRRVIHHGGTFEVIGETPLQALGEHTKAVEFIRQTLHLDRNELIVSPFTLDLADEGGGTRPVDVLRVGIPVRDESGSPAGELQMSLLLDAVVGEMRASSRRSEGRVALAFDNGRILGGADRPPGANAPPHRFDLLFPEAWRVISRLDTGEVTTTEGRFTFDRVNPFQRFRILMETSSAAVGSGLDRDTERNQGWYIISRVEPRRIAELEEPVRRHFRRNLLTLTLLLAALAWPLAVATANRHALEEERRETLTRIAEELDLASRVVNSMRVPPAAGAFPGLRCAFHCETAGGAVGGDHYEILDTPAGTALVLFDVIGHGVPAALHITLARYAFHRRLAAGEPPGETLSRVNDDLHGYLGEDRFVTASLVLLDPARRRLRFACAGCPPPLLLRSGGEVERLTAGGMMLGAFPGLAFETGERALAPGDRIICYTDGLVERRNAGREFYGEARLTALLASVEAIDAEGTLAAIRADQATFAGGVAAADDMTVAVLEILPPAAGKGRA